MIFEQVQQIFDHYPECIVHPVSCTGVSHDFLSKQIKKSYPDYFREYSRFCIRKKLIVGQANFYPLHALFGTQYIVTLTVKNNWQEKLNPILFKSALEVFLKQTRELKIKTIAFPKMVDVPQNWLEDQFKKAALEEENTIEKILLF